jgi:zinc protease
MTAGPRFASLLLLAPLAMRAALAGAPAAAIETWELDDGTEVALVEDQRAPLLSMRVVFPVGTWSPWVRREHAEEAFELQNRDGSAALRRREEALAADIELAMGARTATLSASFLREDLDAVAALMRAVLSNRDYDRRELVARRRGARLAWGLALRDPQFRLAQESARRLFESGDARRSDWEKPAPVETKAARLAAARDALVRLPGRVIGFAGALSRAEADRIARTLLPPTAKETPAGLAPELAPTRVTAGEDGLVRVPRLTQVYFAWLRPSLPWSEPDHFAFLIADHVLGGHFYSRLYSALRHEGGETYGASTSDRGDVVASGYALGTFTRTDNAARAEEKLRRVLAEFHAQGITEDERAAAAAHLEGRLAFARQSPEQILGTYLRERALGLPRGFFEQRAKRAAALSLGEVNAFIRRWYDPAAFTMLKAVPAD